MADSEMDRAAGFLERIFNGGKVVAGRAELVELPDPAPKGKWQKAKVKVAFSAEGFGPEIVEMQYVFNRDQWPVVGTVYRADVNLADPARSDIAWPGN